MLPPPASDKSVQAAENSRIKKEMALAISMLVSPAGIDRLPSSLHSHSPRRAAQISAGSAVHRTASHSALPSRVRFPYKERDGSCHLYVGIPGGNRTHNYALGEHCYIHLTTETY